MKGLALVGPLKILTWRVSLDFGVAHYVRVEEVFRGLLVGHVRGVLGGRL